MGFNDCFRLSELAGKQSGYVGILCYRIVQTEIFSIYLDRAQKTIHRQTDLDFSAMISG